MTDPQVPTTNPSGVAAMPQPFRDLAAASAPAIRRDGKSDRPTFIARAPGRLDVIGGFCDYAGGSTIATTIAGGVAATVQSRDDALLVVSGVSNFASENHQPYSINMNIFDGPDGVAHAADVADQLPKDAPLWLKATVAVIHQMKTTGMVNGCDDSVPDGRPAPGLTIVLNTDLHGEGDGRLTATGAAVLLAAAHAWDAHLDPATAAGLLLRAENNFLQRPVGVATAVGVLHGRAGLLTHACGATGTIKGEIPIPDRLAIVGVYCGPRSENAIDKFADARAAAFMGLQFINALSEAALPQSVARRFHRLAEVSITDYTDKFRLKLPTRITGASFLERFERFIDAHTNVHPKRLYRIRSRSEHHIYEADRSVQFANLLSRTTPSVSFNDECAALISGSHWSYGQRCGLGSVNTERFVTLTKRPSRPGLIAARASCLGTGGVTTVILENTDQARESLNDVIREFEQLTHQKTHLIQGASPGALHAPVLQVDS